MIPQQIPVNNRYGNNSATIFSFDFFVENSSQLIVTHTDFDGKETVLEYGVDYELTSEFPDDQGVGITSSIYGGRIKFPLDGSEFSILAYDETTGQREILSIALTLPIEQPAEYNDSSELNLENMEYSFDYLTRLIQILARQLDLTLKTAEGSNVNLSLPQPKANNTFIWNADATALENYDLLNEFEAFKTQARIEQQEAQNEFAKTLVDEDTGVIPIFKREVEEDIQIIDNKVLSAIAEATQALENTIEPATGETAIHLASDAKTNADNALIASSNAEINSQSALDIATNASSVATTALTTANSASSVATAASTKVDEFGESIEKVIEAAKKIEELEGAVEEAKEAAGTATVAAGEAVVAADNATKAAEDAIAALSSKQDKLIAGANISITNNTISVTGDLGAEIIIREW